MSEYSGIRGTRVKYLSSDPTLNTSTEGQVWYNSTSGTLKSLVQIKAWSSGGNMNTARYHIGSTGTQTAGLGMGGYTPGGVNYTATEEYSGYSWTTSGNLATARFSGGALGTQTSALYIGGVSYPPVVYYNNTEEYDGSTWTAGGAYPASASDIEGFGIQTAGVAVGQNTPSNGATNHYNGSTWTSSNPLNTARNAGQAFGIQTAGAYAGGYIAAATNAVEHYNGTSWTSVTNMNIPRYHGGSSKETRTGAIVFSGISTGPSLNSSEEYDGSTWVSSVNSTIARRYSGGAGASSSAALAFAGEGPPTLSSTEEYNSNINAITQAAWASGGTLATSRNRIGGAGTQTAALGFGGSVSPGAGEPTVSTATEEYNGSSWTAGGALGTARYGVKGCGIQTAGLAVGGVINPNALPGATRDTEEYNGSSWTASSDTNNNFYLDGVAGTQTAAVIRSALGGPGNYTEEYNGATWTTVPGTIGTARYAGSFIGTQTAAIYCGGEPPTPAGFLSDTYDGSTFSSAPSMVLQFKRGGGAGSQTDAVVFAPSTASVATQQYNGISWVTSANMASQRNSVADSPAATASAALAAGGGPGVKNNTEEFTGGTEVATASTLTTS